MKLIQIKNTNKHNERLWFTCGDAHAEMSQGGPRPVCWQHSWAQPAACL